jgi:hypothetical protein
MNTTTVSGWGASSVFGALVPTYVPIRRWRVLWPADSSQWVEASATAQLEAIAELADDWDGYGGAAVDAAAIVAAKAFLSQLIELPHSLLPNANGTVSLEWDFYLGRAHLEVGTEKFSFYAAPREGQPTFLSGDVQVDNAEDINIALAAVTQASSAAAITPADWASGVALPDQKS